MKIKCDIYGYPIYNQSMRKYMVKDSSGNVLITIEALGQTDAETRVRNLLYTARVEQIEVEEIK